MEDEKFPPKRHRKRYPNRIDALSEWTLAWTEGLPNESEAEIWLLADIVPLLK